MPGYIKLYREVQEHWIYKDADYFKTWVEMLMRTRYTRGPKTDTYMGVIYTLNYGEFIFGRPEWSKRLGVGEQKLRTLIRKLISSDMIVLQSKHCKFTVYKIANYEKYNQIDNHVPDLERSGIEGDDNQQDNQHPTSTQPAPNQHPTTNEEREERKKGKKVIKDICPSNQFQPPNINEVKAYCIERNNDVDAEKWHDFYSSKGWMVGKNKMKDWKAAVRTWEHSNKKEIKNKSSNPFLDRLKEMQNEQS